MSLSREDRAALLHGQRLVAAARSQAVLILDALDAAEARVAELEAERDADERAAGSRYLMTREDLMRGFNEKSDALARAEEQNERLVGALQQVRDWIREGKGTEAEAAEAMDAILSEVEGEA